MKAIKTYAIFLIFLTILAITSVLAQPYNLASVNWAKYIKLSEGYDEAYGTYIFSEYLAVVGEADWRPTLVLLDRSTGYIVRKWVGKDYYSYFSNCFSVGNMLYAVSSGHAVSSGVIYAFDKDLNLLNKAEGPSRSWFVSITYDGEYLYIGGSILKDINLDGISEEIWYIEKRTKSLELISYKELYTRNWENGYIADLGINPATGELWAVGGYSVKINNEYKDHSLIVIFDKELRELNRIDYPKDNEYYLGWLRGICFDNIGNAYVGNWAYIGGWSWSGVAKFDKNGNILKVNKDARAKKITFINGLVYTFSDVYVDNYCRHVLYILDSELDMIEKHVLSENVTVNSFFNIGRPCFDGKNVYVAGYDHALNKSRWVVYSIAVKPLPPGLYKVEVLSNLAPAYGSGWYHSGELANVGLNELKDNYYYDEGGKVRYNFQGWEVKKGNINPSSSSSFSFNVYEPVVIQAKFGPPEYLVCIDNSCNYFEKGSTIPAQQDIPTLGGLIIKKFEGYIDNYGNNLGKSVVVNGPLTLSSAYREELNLPLLSVIIVVVFVIINYLHKLKIGKESGTEIKETKTEEKTGTEVKEAISPYVLYVGKDFIGAAKKSLGLGTLRGFCLEEMLKNLDIKAQKLSREEVQSRLNKMGKIKGAVISKVDLYRDIVKRFLIGPLPFEKKIYYNSGFDLGDAIIIEFVILIQRFLSTLIYQLWINIPYNDSGAAKLKGIYKMLIRKVGKLPLTEKEWELLEPIRSRVAKIGIEGADLNLWPTIVAENAT